MKTTTIRVAVETRDRLNDLARRRGAPTSEVVAALVQEADDRALLTAACLDWERLCDDSAALASYQAQTHALPAFEAAPPPY